MKISKLRTNHIENPIGYTLGQPTVSWIVSDAKGKQSVGARIVVSTDEGFQNKVYDSGKVENADSLGFPLPMKIEDGVRYYWNVQVWDDAGDTAISENAFFEIAKQMESANWIGTPFSQELHPLFRKSISFKEKPEKARLYITGLGVYEAYINGKKVGDEYLTPFYNDYNLWVQYQTYDVTEMFGEGENVLGVMLGNGWYKGRFGFERPNGDLYGDSFALFAELHFEYKDGRKEVIKTDENWLTAPSPVENSNIYDGEVYDSRKEILGWAEAKADESKFVSVKVLNDFSKPLTARYSLPLKIMKRMKPVQLLHTPAGEQVLDFGQVMSGWLEFNCSEKEGQEVFLQFGEILQDDNFYNENLRSAKQEYRYISNGKTNKVRPHFTFYGFRYVKVTGISEIKLEDFEGCVIYSEMETTGEIKTSNEKVNQLFKNAFWGQIGNFLDVPTDCPQRDERMGWTGDAQIFCATANFNTYTPAFYRKYMHDLNLEQQTLGGSVPHVVPDIVGQVRSKVKEKKEYWMTSHGSCAWGDAAVVIPWNLYKSFGDKNLLEEQYQGMKQWVDYIRKEDVEKCGGSYLWTTGFHFADWLALDNYKKTNFGATDNYYVASAYYYYCAGIVAKAAHVLGKTEDEAYYADLAEKICEAIQKEYFTPSGRCAVDTQTAMVLALYMNFVPKEYRERLIRDLHKKLEEENMHLTTGFVGTGFLCNALTENNLAEDAYTLLLNEDYPSWLYEVNMGATTVWERWNSVLPDGHLSGTGMNSMNHYAYGAIVEWMYRYMCGVNPREDVPGYKKFVVKPYVDSRFKYAQMIYDSASGRIESGWKKTETGYEFQVVVPFDTEAEFIVTSDAKDIAVSSEDGTWTMSERSIYLKPGKFKIFVNTYEKN